MRPLLFLSLVIILAAGCNSKTASVTSGSVNAEAPFIWEGSDFPKDIYYSENFVNTLDPTEDKVDEINEMLDVWESSMLNYDFFTKMGPATEKTDTITSTSQLRDNKFVIYKATKWPYPEFKRALAITQIFAIRYNRGDKDEYVDIQEADIIMNYQWFEFDTGGFDYDFRTVLLHELGHFLGLSHKPESYDRDNTIMYPSITSIEIKQAPLTVDKQDMAAKYSLSYAPLNSSGSSIVAPKKVYKKKPGDQGEMTKIILELRADGECVHHVDGEISSRHQTR